MRTAPTNRRDLLRLGTATGVSVAVLGLAAPSLAAGASPSVSPALTSLMAEFEAVNATIDRFYAEVFNPAVDRSKALRAAIPHVTIPPSPNWRGDPTFWSTDHPEGVAMGKRLVALEPRTSKRSDVVCARKLVAAMRRRDRAAKQADQTSGVTAASEREEALYVPYRRLKASIHAFPVRSLADLQAKLAFIERDDGMDGEDLLPLVIADLARLSAGEA